MYVHTNSRQNGIIPGKISENVARKLTWFKKSENLHQRFVGSILGWDPKSS